MFHYDTKLDPPLRPEDYAGQPFFDREQATVFARAWHFAALTSDVSAAGDHYAFDVMGVPLVVRNVGGELRVFRNICLHRHCRVVEPGPGHGENLRCSYHGWEYGDDGQIAKIPDGKSFKGLQARDFRLGSHRVETLGPLIMVNLDPEAPALRASLGDMAGELDHFLGRHRVAWRWVTEYPVNWKIIVENAVESYHVPALHPGTFANYKPEEHHDHQLHPAFTSYLDVAPMGTSLIERGLKTYTTLTARAVRFERAKHTHVFPNHLFDYREICSLYSAVEPLGPQRTRFTNIGFLPRDFRFPLIGRPMQEAFRIALTRMARRIMGEDVGIWTEVQRGLEHSSHKGVLSCREERVYAFQQYIANAVRFDGAGS